MHCAVTVGGRLSGRHCTGCLHQAPRLPGPAPLPRRQSLVFFCEEDVHLKELLARWTMAFPFVLMCHLRETSDVQKEVTVSGGARHAVVDEPARDAVSWHGDAWNASEGHG